MNKSIRIFPSTKLSQALQDYFEHIIKKLHFFLCSFCHSLHMETTKIKHVVTTMA